MVSDKMQIFLICCNAIGHSNNKEFTILKYMNRQRTTPKLKYNKNLESVVNNLDETLKLINDNLEKIYKSSLQIKPCIYKDLTGFLIAKQDYIFTSKQMVDLLSRLEEIGSVDRAKNRAKYHKKKYGIEYFSKKRIKEAISELKASW